MVCSDISVLGEVETEFKEIQLISSCSYFSRPRKSLIISSWYSGGHTHICTSASSQQQFRTANANSQDKMVIFSYFFILVKRTKVQM